MFAWEGLVAFSSEELGRFFYEAVGYCFCWTFVITPIEGIDNFIEA